MNKKLVAVAMTGMLAGGAGAAVITSPMTALAADSTTTTAAAQTARSPMQWASDALKGLVDNGTITQAQSDAVSKALEDAKPDRGPGGHHGGGFGLRGSADEVASLLGVSATDLKTAMRDGKSLATIADEKNVDVQKVIDLLVKKENERIDQAVTDGRLTQAQADERKADTATRVTEMVNNTRPEGGRGFGPGGRGGDVKPSDDAASS